MNCPECDSNDLADLGEHVECRDCGWATDRDEELPRLPSVATMKAMNA